MGLGTEGYSPAVLRKAVGHAARATSFQQASAELKDLAGLAISASHLQRLTRRVGQEWAQARQKDVEAFRVNRLAVAYAEPPQAAAVMVDGGRLQTRQADAGPGVTDPGWHEYKAACCLTLSSQVSAVDPQPEPPSKFLEPTEAARLTAEIKGRGSGGKAGRGCHPRRDPGPGERRDPGPSKRKRRRAKRQRGPRRLVRTVLASGQDSEAFGWQVAAEVHRRGLHRAQRKAFICDGQRYNWTLFELHFVALGFLAVLDFLHLLGYLYAAAQAVAGKGSGEAWSLYQQWLREAWAGRVQELLEGLQAGCARLGAPPEGCGEDDPRRVAQEAWQYVRNNRSRMDYPRYRCLGLPISSAPVESTIKQLNRRVKGTEKFWSEGEGVEAILQLRAAHLSEDGTADRYWNKPRPPSRAVGGGRLCQSR